MKMILHFIQRKKLKNLTKKKKNILMYLSPLLKTMSVIVTSKSQWYFSLEKDKNTTFSV